MLQLPREVNPGEPIRASDFNLVLRYLRSITPRSSTTNQVLIGPGGAKSMPVVPRPSAPTYADGQLLGALQPAGDASTGSTPRVLITTGTYGGIVPTIDGTALVVDASANIITLGVNDQCVYMQCDFSYDRATGIKSVGDSMLKSSSLADVPGITCSGGSGTVYQIIFLVTVTIAAGSGNASVAAAPGVSTSQDFNVCLGPAGADSVSGPFRV